MKRRLAAWAATLLVSALASVGVAAEWGGITPGMSTHETVRARYGNPSQESRETVEGYPTTRWVYQGAAAPVGMKRMVVDFGLLSPQGYRPTVVRSMTLEPKPGVFRRGVVVGGWGSPDRIGTEEEREVFYYASGLVVYFAKGGADAITMLFTIPQTEPPKPGR